MQSAREPQILNTATFLPSNPHANATNHLCEDNSACITRSTGIIKQGTAELRQHNLLSLFEMTTWKASSFKWGFRVSG